MATWRLKWMIALSYIISIAMAISKIYTRLIAMYVTALLCGAARAQTNVSTGSLKHPMLEEGTGTWCSWCPEGTQIIHEQIKPTYPRTVCVAHHNNDTMTIAGDLFNSVYAHGFPSASVDRIRWNYPLDTGTGIGRENWQQAVDSLYLIYPTFEVAMFGLYDSAMRKVTLTVTGTALQTLTGQYRINAYIVEDSIPSLAPKFQQHSAYFDDTTSWYYDQCISPCSSSYPCISCALLPDTVYKHENVVRKILGGGGSIYGDPAFVDPDTGAVASRTYTYTLPTYMNAQHVSVVGFVLRYGATYIDREVQNAIEARIGLMDSSLPVADIHRAISDLSLFPDPASGSINIAASVGTSSPVHVIISNMVGQVIYSHGHSPYDGRLDEHVSLDGIPPGMYILSIVHNNERVTKRFTLME